MTNTNATNLRKNLFEYLNLAIEFGDAINVNTKKGNAVIIGEEEYNSLIETLHVSSVPGMKKALIESLDEPIQSMTDADSLEW